MVDTGTPYTSVTPAQVKAWNLAHLITPCQDDYYQGVIRTDAYYESSYGDPRPNDTTTPSLIAHDFCFYIRECSYNLLGLDFLTATCSILNLERQMPELRVYQPPEDVSDYFELTAELAVNGEFVHEFTLDTGFYGFMSITTEDAA